MTIKISRWCDSCEQLIDSETYITLIHEGDEVLHYHSLECIVEEYTKDGVDPIKMDGPIYTREVDHKGDQVVLYDEEDERVERAAALARNTPSAGPNGMEIYQF